MLGRWPQHGATLALPSIAPTAARAGAAASFGLLSVVVGVAAGSGHATQVFELLAMAVVGWLCLTVSWLAAVLVTVTVASFAYVGALPEVHGIKLSEILLAIGLATTALRAYASPMPRAHAERQISALLAVFLVTEAIGVVVGLHGGASVADVAHGLRPAIYVASFWIFAQLVRNPMGRRTVFGGACSITLAVVFLQVLQVHSGAFGRNLFLTSPDYNTITLADGFTRVRPPGLTLVYATAMFSIAYLFWGPPRRRLLVAVIAALALLGVLLSLNRNMLIGLALGISLAALVTPRRRRAVTTAAILGCVISLGAAFVPSAASTQAHPIVERILSLGDFTGLQRNTLEDRYYENHLALHILRRHPILGIGWGASYGARVSHLDTGLVVSEPRGYIHQQYLFLWLRTGLLGLVSFVGMIAVAFVAAWRSSRAARSPDQWVGAGSLATLTAIATGALVANYFSDAESIVPLVAVLALAATMRTAVGEAGLAEGRT